MKTNNNANTLLQSEHFLTLDEVAKILRVSPSTIWRWRVFRLPGMFRIGRKWLIKESDLEKFINRQIQLAQ